MRLKDLLKKKKKDNQEVEKKVEEGTQDLHSVRKTEEKVDEKKNDFVDGLVSTKDIIAPSAIEVDFNHIRIDNKYYRTLFVAGYPRFVGINWLSSLINFDASLNVSMYIYPTDGKEVLDDLRRKIAEMEAELTTDLQRGKIVNPSTQAKLEDALNLQQDLVKGEERFFQFGLYVTISSETREGLDRINKNIESALGSLMIISKKATLQMEEGFTTTLPICNDRLKVTRNMDTTSLATTFPFVSSDLSDDKGIMYGINEHNGSLVIFDRFSMPNYNSVVFATSGAGKSYMVKLEAMRSLMFGTEILVIDPENEYKEMCEAVGGQYIAFGYDEASKINPFDLSLLLDNEEDKENALNNKMLSLHKLFKVMLGDMDPLDESILDKAVVSAYKAKGITPDPETQRKEPPLLEDLYKALIGMEEEKARLLAARLEKFIKGSFAGIFNQKTTVELKNRFVVFGIRNLEDALRPLAMHIILDYIWTVVKRNLKKRILIVDEAWYMMQYDDSAAFLRGIIKRGRKYYLGVTTITQDVDDFLETPYGKEIVTNSSIQILLKQHSAAIDKIGAVFYLSEGEKQLLLSADKGEGIFFAGQNHVAIRVIGSESEHKLITSDPEELLKMKGKKLGLEKDNKDDQPINPAVSVNIEEDEEPSTKMNVPVTGKRIGEKTKKGTQNLHSVQKTAKPNAEVVDSSKLNIPPTEEKKIDESVDRTVVLDERGKTKVNSLQNSETKVNNVNRESESLEAKIARMEEEEKIKLTEHEKKVSEEDKAKQATLAEKNKTLYSSGLPKYKDLFKSYGPPTSSGAKLPPLPPIPTKGLGGNIPMKPKQGLNSAGNSTPVTPAPISVPKPTPIANNGVTQGGSAIPPKTTGPVVKKETQQTSVVLPLQKQANQIGVKTKNIRSKPVIKNDGVNPFAPKEVPKPDLSKVKPIIKQNNDKQTPLVSKDEQVGKVDRKDVKVEVKQTKARENKNKSDDKKGVSYDDLFGN